MDLVEIEYQIETYGKIRMGVEKPNNSRIHQTLACILPTLKEDSGNESKI